MALEILKKIWPEWTIGKRIGGGSYGVVYDAIRSDYNVESHAAIKIVSIPTSQSELDSLRSEGMDQDATKTYLQELVNNFVNEIQMMVSLEGSPNIVNVQDYRVVEKPDEFGWYIFIRMELLTPFDVYICDKTLSEQEIIRLGCDICTALEICANKNIIHRDIKPGNILVHTDTGNFKLGDFGVARKLENVTGGLSQRGTRNYMAPEVANSTNYDARVDLYSLGIVLYRLLNGNRLPFLQEKQMRSPNEMASAVERRIQGEAFPAPCDASPAMAALILQACAYDPNERFASATEMKQALMSVASDIHLTHAVNDSGKNTSVPTAPVNPEKTVSVRAASGSYDKTVSVRKAQPETCAAPPTSPQAHPKRSKPRVIAMILAALFLVCGCIVVAFMLKSCAESEKTEEYTVFEERLISDIVFEADVLAADGDYESAYTKVHDALDDYPKSTVLRDKLEEYAEALYAQGKEPPAAETESIPSGNDKELSSQPYLPEAATEQTITIAHKHEYEPVSMIKATCTTNGNVVYQCSCGAGYNLSPDTKEFKALGHDYETKVVPPTASSRGYTVYTCRRCEDSYRDNYTAPVTQTDPTVATSENSTVKISHTDVSLSTGSSFQIYLMTESSERIDAVWKSSNPKVADVSGNTVIGLDTGVTTITTEYEDKQYSCIVRVENSIINNDFSIPFDDLV